MPYNFDSQIERRDTGSIKWGMYDADVLPAWVADMDFRSPEPIIDALQARVEHGIFGYQFDSPTVREVIAQRLAKRYHWNIQNADMTFLPNLVSALNFSCLAYAEPGDEVLTLTPMYPPFLVAPVNGQRILKTVDLTITRDGQLMRYEIDFDAFEAAITPRTKIFMHCNPHNPVGRAWSREEQEKLAEICLRHNLIIISDEIHCDLLLEGQQHIPMANLSPEVAAQTLTLMAPSKTFNLPTLGFGFAVAQNPELLKRFTTVSGWYLPHPGALAFAAAKAAYTHCDDWLADLLVYLKGNRDYLVQYAAEHFPQIPITSPEATYLGWLDFRALNLPEGPYKFFLDKARVALNDGAPFGKAGEGFLRLNFGTPRSMLTSALDRMSAALETASV